MDIAIDIDGVLCNTIAELKSRLETEFKLEFPEENLDRFNLTETLRNNSIPSTWLMKSFKDPWFWSKGLVYEENVETVNRWNERYTTHLVTGRGNDVAIPTVAWLKRMGVNYSKLYFTPSMTKYDYMLKANCAVLFEDSFFEANKVASYGMRAFVIARPWNVEYQERITNPLVSYINELSDGESFLEKYEEFVL